MGRAGVEGPRPPRAPFEGRQDAGRKSPLPRFFTGQEELRQPTSLFAAWPPRVPRFRREPAWVHAQTVTTSLPVPSSSRQRVSAAGPFVVPGSECVTGCSDCSSSLARRPSAPHWLMQPRVSPSRRRRRPAPVPAHAAGPRPHETISTDKHRPEGPTSARNPQFHLQLTFKREEGSSRPRQSRTQLIGGAGPTTLAPMRRLSWQTGGGSRCDFRPARRARDRHSRRDRRPRGAPRPRRRHDRRDYVLPRASRRARRPRDHANAVHPGTASSPRRRARRGGARRRACWVGPRRRRSADGDKLAPKGRAERRRAGAAERHPREIG